jgi:hypothetical protein
MGNHNIKEKAKPVEKKIVNDIFCPFCNKGFVSHSSDNSFNFHVRSCGFGLNKEKLNKCSIYPPSLDIQLNESIFKNQQNYLDNIDDTDKEGNFDDKLKELKATLDTLQKKGTEYKTTLYINRQKIISSTLSAIKNLDVLLDWKIDFEGEYTIDVGGISREFFTSIFHTLESEDLSLFVRSENNEFSFILNPFLMPNQENESYCRLIGILMAKSLLQNVTINICFNKLIYKMILQERVTFDDLVFIDSSMYGILSNLKDTIAMTGNNDIIKELDFNYSIDMKDNYNHLHSLELIEKGSKKTVEDLDDLIQKRINLLIGLYEPFVKIIRETIFKYIPKEKIRCFNTNELELIFNGRPFLDLEEWELNTDYLGGYSGKDQIIKWFWEILHEFTQKELSNLLLFATGNSRVPLGGFAELESTKGNKYKFGIEAVPYEPNRKNYIKAHTCFNKIDLPRYPNKAELEEMIRFVSEKEMWGFGIE